MLFSQRVTDIISICPEIHLLPRIPCEHNAKNPGGGNFWKRTIWSRPPHLDAACRRPSEHGLPPQRPRGPVGYPRQRESTETISPVASRRGGSDRSRSSSPAGRHRSTVGSASEEVVLAHGRPREDRAGRRGRAPEQGGVRRRAHRQTRAPRRIDGGYGFGEGGRGIRGGRRDGDARWEKSTKRNAPRRVGRSDDTSGRCRLGLGASRGRLPRIARCTLGRRGRRGIRPRAAQPARGHRMGWRGAGETAETAEALKLQSWDLLLLLLLEGGDADDDRPRAVQQDAKSRRDVIEQQTPRIHRTGPGVENVGNRSAAQVIDHFLRVFKTDHRVDAGGFIRVGSRRRHETLRVGPHVRPT